jgi:hypothetical protein
LRAAVAANPTYPPLLFVHQGTPEEGAAFFADYWPEARAVADGADLPLYRAFGLTQGSPSALVSLGVMVCAFRAIAKGNLPGTPQGDTRQMPGLFCVQGAQVLWQHDYAHAGDSPDWEALPGVVESRESRVEKSIG